MTLGLGLDSGNPPSLNTLAARRGAYSSSAPPPPPDFSVLSAGTNEIGKSTDAGMVTGANPWTWGVLLETTENSVDVLFNYGNQPSGHDITLYLNGPNTWVFSSNGGLNTQIGTRVVNDGLPHLVGLSYDGTSLVAWLDGTTDGSPVVHALALSLIGAGGYVLGAQQGTPFPYTGTMERVFYRAGALTAPQWAALAACTTATAFQALLTTYSPLHSHGLQDATNSNFVDGGSLNVPLTHGAAGITWRQAGLLLP